MNGNLKISLACRSIIGSREEQQDYIDYSVVNNNLIAAVCDGMGGLKMGSLASYVTVKSLFSLFRKKEASETIPDFFLNIIDILDEKVCSLVDENGDASNAGTTISAICISGNILYWLSVGDSRIYILRGNELEAATRDHNYRLFLDKMLENGSITQEHYQQELPRAEALVSFIGKGGIEIMDINNGFRLQNNDIILITSDGLYKNLSNESIKHCINSSSSVEEAADRLIELSEIKNHSSSDNVSFILIKTEAESNET